MNPRIILALFLCLGTTSCEAVLEKMAQRFDAPDRKGAHAVSKEAQYRGKAPRTKEGKAAARGGEILAHSDPISVIKDDAKETLKGEANSWIDSLFD